MQHMTFTRPGTVALSRPSTVVSGIWWNNHRCLSILCVLLFVSGPLLPIRSSARSSLYTPQILIIKSGNAAVYNEIADSLQQHLGAHCSKSDSNCTRAELHSFVSNAAKPVYRRYDLVITLGLKARQYAAQQLPDSAIINAMIPREARFKQNTHKKPTVILDQPLDRSLRLVKLTLPQAQQIGILISRSNQAIVQSAKETAASLGMEIVTGIVDNEAEIGKKLTLLLDQVDVLLTLPDIRVHNRNTVPNILLSAYRKRVPVIGFSAAYVQAGAFAAVYSEPDDIAQHLMELAGDYFKKGKLKPAVIHPKYFSIAINGEVARSLGISPPDQTDIENQLFLGGKL